MTRHCRPVSSCSSSGCARRFQQRRTDLLAAVRAPPSPSDLRLNRQSYRTGEQIVYSSLWRASLGIHPSNAAHTGAPTTRASTYDVACHACFEQRSGLTRESGKFHGSDPATRPAGNFRCYASPLSTGRRRGRKASRIVGEIVDDVGAFALLGTALVDQLAHLSVTSRANSSFLWRMIEAALCDTTARSSKLYSSTCFQTGQLHAQHRLNTARRSTARRSREPVR